MRFNKREWSYIFYDWAESCFTVIVQAFIFPMLYGLLSRDLVGAGSLFGILVSLVSLSVAVLSPILGTVADYRGYKKRFFLAFFALGIVFTFLIAFFPAEPSLWWMVLIPYVLASIGYAGTNVFYDSFIVDATDDENMDRVSATAYAFGYIGGSTIPLVAAIVLLQVLPAAAVGGRLTVLGLSFPYDVYVGFRATFIMTGLWWLLFSLPFLKNVNQAHGIDPEPKPLLNSFRRLGRTFSDIRPYRKVFIFLAAYFLYIDGVHTIIAMAVPFATDAIEAVTEENATAVLLPILLAIQVAAFFFALLFSRLSRTFRTSTLLYVTIGVYCVIAAFAAFVSEVWHFWILGLLVSTSQGAIQSLSRSYFGKIVPKDMANEFFGFYTIFGRFASVLGPALIGGISLLAISAFGNLPGGTMRYGVLSLSALFVAGAWLFRLAEKTPAGAGS